MHVKFASLNSVCKKIDCVAVAWFMLIHPVESPDAMGACDTLAGGNFVDA